MAMNTVPVWEGALKQIIEDLGTGTTYIGEAPVGAATSSASWRIQKIVVSGGTTTITWASSKFDQIWDNRASLSYS